MNVTKSKTILVETATPSDGTGAPQSQLNSSLPGGQVAGYASLVVNQLSASIQEVIDAVAEAVKPSATGPESCQVKFGLKVSGQGNVILAKMGSELTMEVTVTWKRAS